MSQRSGISRINWMSAQSVTVTPASPPQLTLGCAAYGVTLRLNAASTGTLAGSFALQVTDFGVDESTLPPLSTDWVTVTGSSQTWAGSPLVWTFNGNGNKWLRILFSNSGSSGAPIVDAAFSGKCWET